MRAEQKIPGLQVAIIRQQKIIKTASYGLTNIQDSVAVDDKTLFTINSMTKAFTGIAVMQLVEQGKIQLSAAISDYLPDLPLKWRTITVNQLLAHTSGLPNIMNEHFELINSAGETQSWADVEQLPLDFEPGTIIEKVAGKTYAQLINEHQLQKIGMPRAVAGGFAHFQTIVHHRARGHTTYVNDKLTNVKTGLPAIIRPGVGMSSTATELAQWLIALQNSKLFNKSNSLTTMWSPVRLTTPESGGTRHPFALGWSVLNRQEHPGIASTGGDRAALIVYPNDNLAIVVLTNLMGANPVNFIDEIAALYIPSMKKENGFGLLPSTKILWKAL